MDLWRINILSGGLSGCPLNKLNCKEEAQNSNYSFQGIWSCIIMFIKLFIILLHTNKYTK